MKTSTANKSLDLTDIIDWLNQKGYRRGMDVYIDVIASLIKAFIDEYESRQKKEPITYELIEKKAMEYIRNEHYPIARSKKEAVDLIVNFFKSTKQVLSLKAQPIDISEESLPYPNPVSQHQTDQNIGYIKAIRAMKAQKAQPGDEDIWNAAKEYAKEHGRAFYSEHFQAYKDGAIECRDKKIYISPDGQIPAKDKE
jgi:hypothetical protein